MKQIQLTKNKVALVDDGDYEKINQYKWYFCLKGKNDNTGYAIHDFRANPEIIKKYGSRHISIHRFLLNPPKGLEVDHINGNGLDNRRENLRTCNSSENHANISLRKDNQARFKGVETHTSRKNTWFVRLKKNKIRIYIGCFHDPIEAAKAYNKAAIEYFGEFARLNKV